MIKLKLRNFQPYTKADLEFDKGLTLIVGPSSSGKTSIIRALQLLLLNWKGSGDLIRSGAKELGVSLEIDGFPRYAIKKTKKDSLYLVGDRVYKKVGMVSLFDIDNKLPFIVDNNKVLNIHDEWTIPMIYSYSSSDLFKFFERFADFVDTSELLFVIKKDISLTDSRINDLQVKNEKYEHFVSEASVILEKEQTLNTLVDKLKHLQLKNDKIIKLRGVDKFRSITLEPLDAKNVSDTLIKMEKLETFISLGSYRNIELPRIKKINFNKIIDKLQKLSLLVSLAFVRDEVLELPTVKLDCSRVEQYGSLLELGCEIEKLLQELAGIKDKVTTVKKCLSEFKICPLCGTPLVKEGF